MKKKENLISLVEQGEAIKAHQLEHLQRARSLGQVLASQCKETMRLASELREIDAPCQHCLGYLDSLYSSDFSMI